MHRRPWLLLGAVVVVTAGIAQARNLDGFARCLRAKRTTFYGTVWCPQCSAQRALFGRSARWLPYVECSIDGTQAIRPECADIGGFPMWVFRDGSRIAGRVPLARLSQKTGCALDAPVRDEPLVIDVPGAGRATSPNESGVQIIEIP